MSNDVDRVRVAHSGPCLGLEHAVHVHLQCVLAGLRSITPLASSEGKDSVQNCLSLFSVYLSEQYATLYF